MYPTRKSLLDSALSRRTLLGGLSALGLVTVVGCRSAAEEADKGSGAAKPVRGGTLVTTVNAAPVPGAYFTGRPGNIFWCRNVLETLLLIDTDGKAQPLLATEWSLSNGNKTFTAKLREGVTFHSGRAFTADDVVFSLERNIAGDGLATLNGAMKGWQIKATGRHEVTITSPRPLQETVHSILDATPIIDQETQKGLADGSKVVGTGPFVWSGYQAGTKLTMKRNDSYWADGLPYLDGIEITVIADSTAQLAALRSDRVQIANGLSVQDSQTIVDDKTFHLDLNKGLVYGLGLTVDEAPFDNVDVRRAVGYAIDRERINKQVMGGLATTASLPWGKDATGYPADLAGTYTYDPDRARKLIKAAGATGAQFKLALHNLPVPRQIYEIIARNLSDVGLKPSPLELSIADFEPRRAAGKLGPAFLTWTAVGDMPPALMLDALPELRPAKNAEHYTDKEYQRLAQALIDSPDESATKSRLRSLSQKLLDDAFFLPYTVSPSTSVSVDSVRGVVTGRYGRTMRAAYLAK
ncbi:ABC transporter substrate-binding protein [Streptomyces sp. NPDC002838]|uniref:ABC transporter substrate-binding protein n=1 Tax=Streptomyces sp. NPDC002838 TaxID=3154436 RepID=UPI0033186486